MCTYFSIILCEEGVRCSSAVFTSCCSTNSMNVIFDLSGKVKIDDKFNIMNILRIKNVSHGVYRFSATMFGGTGFYPKCQSSRVLPWTPPERVRNLSENLSSGFCDHDQFFDYLAMTSSDRLWDFGVGGVLPAASGRRNHRKSSK